MSTENQNTKLQSLIHYVGTHSPFYKKMFAELQFSPGDFKSIDDLQKLPFTEKKHLQEQRHDFICVDRRALIDHASTSGTLGPPVTISLTDADLERLAQNECNSFKMAGITAHDTIQLMTTMDRRFMAGLAYFTGARKLGAGIIRVGNGLPELQWDTILDMKPSALIAVPSFLVKLIEFAEAKGINYAGSSVKKVICIGETIRNPDFSLNTLGKKIVEKWPLQLFSTYASTEMATAFTECEHFMGGHQQEDLIIIEVVDENGNRVKTGEAGELVVTPLGIEGMPLLRFKTGDICTLHTEPCKCGRSSWRLGPLLGRKNQMIKYKGTSFYPAAVFDILENIAEIKNYQVLVHSSDLGIDEISIHLGIEQAENLSINEITDIFRAKLRVVPKLSVLSPNAVQDLLFPENSRKPQKFIDNRRK